MQGATKLTKQAPETHSPKEESPNQIEEKAPAMIATRQLLPKHLHSSSLPTSSAPSSEIIGGVWIDGGSSSEDATVISEITSDHTTVMTSCKNMDDLLQMHQDKNNSSARSTIQGKATANPTTPSTVQTTPSRSNKLEKNAPSPKRRIDDGFHTEQPSSVERSSVLSHATPAVKEDVPAKKAVKPTGTKKTAAKPTSAATKTKVSTKKTKADVSTSATDQIMKAATVSPEPAKTKTAAAAAAAPSKKKKIPAKTNLKAPPPAAVVTPTSTKIKKTAPPTPKNGGAGLSELSKQLRVQRAKNEWQHNEIARLERQLRILSDLKGVSVTDLRFSLESACAEEAHDELRNQVMSLQAQLEAIRAQRAATMRRGSDANEEATLAKIATLQLKVGELEEVDEAKRAEIQDLYKELEDQRARAAKLETINAQQADQIAKFEDVAQTYVQDVKEIKTERDALRQQIQDLQQQLQSQQVDQDLALEMRRIEDQIKAEQDRKQEYLEQARRKKGIFVSGGVSNDNAVVRRLSDDQLGAIQGVVGRQAGGTNEAVTDFNTPDNEKTLIPTDICETTGVTGSGDELDSSVHTIDVLLMQGLSEDQAKEALAKDAKIAKLYEDLREQTTKASRLQTLCANQKAQIEAFARTLNDKEEVVKSTESNYAFAKAEHDAIYKKFCELELQLNLEQEKVDGLERQLHARASELHLRNDQFTCRFQVQNERIADLEQQQSSLYTAFELLQEEVKDQDNEQSKLKSSLNMADSEVARHLRMAEKKQRKGRRKSSGSLMDDSSNRNPMDDFSRGSQIMDESSRRSYMADESSRSFALDVPVPTATASAVSGNALLITDQEQSMRSLQQPSEQLARHYGIQYPIQMFGYLWKLHKIKGWKKRFFMLFGDDGVYHLSYSEGPQEKLKGTVEGIRTGVSFVAETNKSVKKPFSFVLYVNPLKKSTPALYAAAMNADDFHRWMHILKSVTIQPEDRMYMSQPNFSTESQVEADLEVSRQIQSASYSDLSHSHEAQMESDHLLAMRMQMIDEDNRVIT